MASKLPPPPRYAYFRAYLKTIMGASLQRFLGAPQRFAPPPPGKIPAGAHGCRYSVLPYICCYNLLC